MQSPSAASNACLACRKIKVRCRVAVGSTACERCARKSFDCVFQKHRRGRKPGSLSSKLENANPSSDQRPAARTPLPPAVHVSRPSRDRGRDRDRPEISAAGEPSFRAGSVPLTDVESLQPRGLLNHTAMRGRFSLRQILSTEESDSVDQPTASKPAGTASLDDPVRVGLLNSTLAQSLFNSFMTELNPYICQLDPYLHTFAHVKSHSSFLLTSILTVAAKVFNPLLYKRLYSHAQHLLAASFQQGTYSTESAQAILILTYWKEPQDTRAWTILGYVIRMCIDMGFHRLALSTPETRSTLSPLEARKLRDIERTWLVLFVYDRSMSLQTGRPWMIHPSSLIESVDSWCHDELATNNDGLLAAFVTLRLDTCDLYTTLSVPQMRTDKASLRRTSSLLMLAMERIQRWNADWSQYCREKAASEGSRQCHVFLIGFYGLHAQLQLYTLPLQTIIASGNAESSPGLEMMWSAFSSAIEMLHLIQQNPAQLYLAQDSVHVMTAYSAAFLLKLFMSISDTIVKEMRLPISEAIRSAADAFGQQHASDGSSCALQARFLSRIAADVDSGRPQSDRDNGLQPIDDELRGPRPLPTTGTSLYVERDHTGSVGDGPLAINSHCDVQNNFTAMDEITWDDWFATAGFSTQPGMFSA